MTHDAISMKRFAFALAGALSMVAVWVLVKHGLGISDRYLPGPLAVLQAFGDLKPPAWVHLGFTATRLIVGFILGTAIGILLALLMARTWIARWYLTPILQSLRPIPAAAMVPFFLLWFGFSEWGRYLLVVAAIGFNVAIASIQILASSLPAHDAFFHSFSLAPGKLTWSYCLPRILESLLPTLRFSLVVAVGAVTVSELLGSQVGLGYVIQTSRSTFSLHVLFLAAILLGLLSAATDGLLLLAWRWIIYWRR
jgi:ABC-type nitrate/sulfonate/bicarbonate transport system permease component